MRFYGKIELKPIGAGNHVNFSGSSKMSEYIDSMKPGTELQLEIKIKRKFRSIRQNSLYWLWLGVISADTGFTEDELHTTFKSMFLTDHTRKIPIVRSTTVLNTQEFTIYLNKIEDTCREKLEINLPRPEEFYT